MTENRYLGATEARIGLTLITGLLVTLGYVIVQRLSDSPRSQTSLQIPSTYGDDNSQADQSVRTALGMMSSQPAEHQPSYAPKWLEPQPAEPGDVSTR